MGHRRVGVDGFSCMLTGVVCQGLSPLQIVEEITNEIITLTRALLHMTHAEVAGQKFVTQCVAIF